VQPAKIEINRYEHDQLNIPLTLVVIKGKFEPNIMSADVPVDCYLNEAAQSLKRTKTPDNFLVT
jgi:hypothetical protein